MALKDQLRSGASMLWSVVEIFSHVDSGARMFGGKKGDGDSAGDNTDTKERVKAFLGNAILTKEDDYRFEGMRQSLPADRRKIWDGYCERQYNARETWHYRALGFFRYNELIMYVVNLDSPTRKIATEKSVATTKGGGRRLVTEMTEDIFSGSGKTGTKKRTFENLPKGTETVTTTERELTSPSNEASMGFFNELIDIIDGEGDVEANKFLRRKRISVMPNNETLDTLEKYLNHIPKEYGEKFVIMLKGSPEWLKENILPYLTEDIPAIYEARRERTRKKGFFRRFFS